MVTTPPHLSTGLLERRPQASAYKIEDLLDEVQRGRIRIPPFQRGLRWNRDDAQQLLDSLYRGYPVGTLLLWETGAHAQDLQFGSVTIPAAHRSDALWVVDGQQRLVSLIRTLLPRDPLQDEFALYFDLDEGRFTRPPPPKAVSEDPARWLSLVHVLNSEDLIQWLLDNVSTAERRERAIQLGKRLREYAIPVYVVRTDSEEVLRDIFGRVNTRGKQLEAGDVFDALHGARTGSRPATFRDIAQELQSLHFGLVEEKILYRLLRVLQGADVSTRSERELQLSSEEARTAYALTASVAREVIQFLKRDAGIPHYSLLPYKQPIITLGKFFQHHREPSTRSRDLLARWVWRGALSGAHRGDTVSTRHVLEQIDPDSEEASVQRLLAQGAQRTETWPMARDAFNFRFAASKLQALALLARRPVDLASHEPIALEPWLTSHEGGDASPLIPLIQSARGVDSHLLSCVANRWFHSRSPGLRQRILASDAQTLSTHLVSEIARDLLKAGDVQGFLEERANDMDRHFQEFFSQRARWADTDRPSLQSLAIADEEP